MSLMTAVSGGASLLLLLIPGKYEVLSSLVVTCCNTTEYCQDNNNNIYTKVFDQTNEENVTAFCQTDNFGLVEGERYLLNKSSCSVIQVTSFRKCDVKPFIIHQILNIKS